MTKKLAGGFPNGVHILTRSVSDSPLKLFRGCMHIRKNSRKNCLTCAATPTFAFAFKFLRTPCAARLPLSDVSIDPSNLERFAAQTDTARVLIEGSDVVVTVVVVMSTGCPTSAINRP